MQRVVLAVEDNPYDLAQLSDFLPRSGYTMISAHSGEVALELIRARDDICAVLLDWNLPRMSGGETCRQMRDIAPHVPVVILTGATGGEFSGIEEEAPRCGAVYVAHKPFGCKDDKRLMALLGVIASARQRGTKVPPSRRTSLLGIFIIGFCVAGVGWQSFDGNPLTNPDWASVSAMLLAGVSAILAAEHRVLKKSIET